MIRKEEDREVGHEYVSPYRVVIALFKSLGALAVVV